MSSNMTLIKGNSLIKRYKNIISRDMDYSMLMILSNKNLVPKILNVKAHEIEMEYIEGKTILEILALYDKGVFSYEYMVNIIKLLVIWIYEFNKITLKHYNHYINLTDFHFNNFLYDGSRIIGIDFEQYEEGKEEDNYISLLSWLSLYDFKNKDRFMELIMKSKDIVKGYIIIQNIDKSMQQYIEDRLKKRSLYKSYKKTSCVIMSGGENRRMGSHKSELLIGNYTFMDQLLYENSHFDDVILSVNDTHIYEKYNYKMISDVVKKIGPIGGLYSVINNIKNDRFFVCTCDFPYLNEKLFRDMFEEMEQGYDGVVTCYEGKINPLLAIYKKEILNIIKKNIDNENYRLMQLLNELDIKYIEISDFIPKEFVNINNMDQYNLFINHAIMNKNMFPLTAFVERRVLDEG